MSKNPTCVNITHLIRKFFRYGEAVTLTVMDTSLSNFRFLLERQNFTIGHNTQSVVRLCDLDQLGVRIKYLQTTFNTEIL